MWTDDQEITQPYSLENILALEGVATLQTRRDLLDKLLEPLPENFEPNAPRALLDY